MYAIVEVGGKQYLVEKNAKILVEKIPLKEKEEYPIDKVLLVKKEEGEVVVGDPYLKNVKVITEVVQQTKSKKIIVFRRSKSKKNWRRKIGHRQNYTILKVKDIVS